MLSILRLSHTDKAVVFDVWLVAMSSHLWHINEKNTLQLNIELKKIYVK
jgi:hypothetical protein